MIHLQHPSDEGFLSQYPWSSPLLSIALVMMEDDNEKNKDTSAPGCS